MRDRDDVAGREIAEHAQPLPDESDLAPLLDRIGDAGSSSSVRLHTAPPTTTAGEPRSPAG
ncbi:MAG TPA: hypothetical protein VGR26_00805 [Acidimicrobiales bacterium]|nr:hypothetical protein [Acidimicrobiales bacterium]